MSHLKFCSCHGCKANRRKPNSKRIIKAASRRFRHETKAALRQEAEPLKAITVGRTD